MAGTDEAHNLTPNEPVTGSSELFVTGLGASAGGIQALKAFFEQVPADSGIAYVVILHLSPDQDSELASVLQTATTLPVTQVTERIAVQADHVYVIPPNQHLIMEAEHINLSPNLTLEDQRAPVDIFFRSLALSYGPRAICVVLSGTGANGSMGLKHIKEHGGAAFVQNPREAEFNEMPRNSIATDLVDEVLPVAEIPAKILAYKNIAGTKVSPDDAAGTIERNETALREIFTLLRTRTGHDFSNYKRPTLLRRIERRTNMRVLPDLPAYAAFMRNHPEETNALLKDILISVTNFFRDQKAFEAIEKEILPRIMEGRSSEEQVRVWVAGCATGEEAFSLAILLAEKVQSIIDAPRLQIFATDIDQEAIAHAREALYTISDAANVSADRLRRFFIKEATGYRVRKEIRETVLFAHHNFIKDPPFSRIDLISCRNVLIYLNQVAQKRVAETFHFALKPDAFLFLGTAESVESDTDLYLPVNKEYHIFQSRLVAARNYPVLESFPTFHHARSNYDAHQRNADTPVSADRITFGDLHQRLREQYAPPSVIINEESEIVHVSDRAGKYLQIAGGEPSQNLLKLVRPELRLELRSAIYSAMQRKTAVYVKSLQVTSDNHELETINLHVRPVLHDGDLAKGLMLILFEPATADKTVLLPPPDDTAANQLGEELVRVKKQLRNAVEQHEFQAEELKASNEELQAINEELRSAAEELETSKEELRSINEELTTVNEELKVKIEETTLTGNNLRNLIDSVDIGTMFLDRGLRVMLFTPAIKTIFNVIPGDFGRPLSDIAHRLQYQELEADTYSVLERLQAIEREVKTIDGGTYVMHIVPYHTTEDRINGVVISFVDISERKEAENKLKESENRLAGELKVLNDLHSLSVRLLSGTDIGQAASETVTAVCRMVNAGMGSMHLYEPLSNQLSYIAHCSEAGATIVTDKAFQTFMQPYWHSVINTNQPLILDDFSNVPGFKIATDAGFLAAYAIPLTASQQKPVGVLTLYFNTGHTPDARELYAVELYAGQAARLMERDRAEQHIRASEERLRVTVESATDFAIITLNTNGIITNWNKGASNIFGFSEKEAVGQLADIFFTPEDRELRAPEREMKIALLRGRALDERWHQHKDGIKIFMSGVLTPMYNEGQHTGFVKVARDITAQKQAEDALLALEERYRIALKSAEMGTWDWNIKENIVFWNDQHFILLGLPAREQPVNSEFLLQYVHPTDLENLRAGLSKAINGAGVFHAEFRIITADKKETRWVSGYGRALGSGNKHAERMVGVIYDITERKRLEKEKDDFLNIASHEIKTPLTSIKSYAEIVQDLFVESNTPEQIRYMKKMNNQIDRLNELVSDLLDTTKVTEGELPLHLKSFDLNELITERIGDLEHLSPKHSLHVTAGELPLIVADRDRISQVLINLINNAIKYSPGGGNIIVVSRLNDGKVTISVRDQGIGVSEEMQPKVFDRFFRVSNSQANTAPGMGLGLYISAGIVARHKGTISVSSHPGEGAEFSFTIPVSQEQSAENA